MWLKFKRLVAIATLALLTDADLFVPNEWVQAYHQAQVISLPG